MDSNRLVNGNFKYGICRYFYVFTFIPKSF